MSINNKKQCCHKKITAASRYGRLNFFLVFLLLFLLFPAGCENKPNDSQSPLNAADRKTDSLRNKTNLLLITMDTTRADFIGTYGFSGLSTPHVDKLASRGLLFTNAYSTAPFTAPAHASILTSQHPSTHGIVFNGHRVPSNIKTRSTTLAEHLKKLGFQTGAFVSSGVLDGRYGFNRGFDIYQRVTFKQEGDVGGYSLSVAKEAINWLKNIDTGKRFFLWVHFFDPHLPYTVGKKVQKIVGVQDIVVTSKIARSISTDRLRNSYQGDLYEADEGLGKLLNYLETAKIQDQTIVVLTSDHGEYLHEHGGNIDHHGLYEEVLHVPLIFAGPGFKAGQRRTGLISVIDIVPTVTDAMHLQPLVSAQGKSQWKKGSDEKWPVFAEWRMFSLVLYPDKVIPEKDFLASVQVGTKKLIRPVFAPEKSEIYDLEKDPLEQNNLIEKNPELRKRLSGLLDTHIERDLPEGLIGTSHVNIDDESVKMLKSLGYIE